MTLLEVPAAANIAFHEHHLEPSAVQLLYMLSLKVMFICDP